MKIKITCHECGGEIIFDSFTQLENQMKSIGCKQGIYDLDQYVCPICRSEEYGIDMDDDYLDFFPEQKQGWL